MLVISLYNTVAMVTYTQLRVLVQSCTTDQILATQTHSTKQRDFHGITKYDYRGVEPPGGLNPPPVHGGYTGVPCTTAPGATPAQESHAGYVHCCSEPVFVTIRPSVCVCTPHDAIDVPPIECSILRLPECYTHVCFCTASPNKCSAAWHASSIATRCLVQLVAALRYAALPERTYLVWSLGTCYCRTKTQPASLLWSSSD